MSIKLLALGNTLMEDDGIAIVVARELEQELSKLGIEVLYGETDLGYCISRIGEDDFLILLDASNRGVWPGRVGVQSLHSLFEKGKELSHHGLSFLQVWRLYYPEIEGIILSIEIAEVEFYYGLSQQLTDRISEIVQETMMIIMGAIRGLK